MATTMETESKTAAKVTRHAATVDARIAERDAGSARRLREREAEIELRRRESEIRRAERAAKSADRSDKRARRAERRRARRQARIERATTALSRVRDYIAGNAPAVYSAGIYAMALYVAVSGQIGMATERGWPIVFGVGMAVFLEGLALSMALTAHQLRLKGERALVPAAMTWIAAGFASGINFFAHRDDLIMASVLGASSLAAIIVWEVRSGAKHREALREQGMIPEPPERFGLRRWIRYPRSTWRAWSLDVRDRVGVRAAALLEQVEADRTNDRQVLADQAARDAQWGALALAATAAQDAKLARAVAADAVKTAARAPRRGFLARFKRAATETAPASPVQSVRAERTASAEKPTAPAGKPDSGKPKSVSKPSGPARKPRPSGDVSVIEDAFVDLYADTGKRPGARAIEAAVDGVRKKSAIHSWMANHPGRLAELSARAEAIRAGREASA